MSNAPNDDEQIDSAQPRRRRRGLWWKIPLGLMLGGILFVSGLISAYVYSLWSSLPDTQGLEQFRPSSITRVYDRQGEPIAEFFREKRIPVDIHTLPEHVYLASVAVEDATFFEHDGLDFQGIFRAFMTNLEAGRVVEGGSTITQQLAKTMYLTAERRLSRKIKEAFLAYKIDRNLDKMRILELYLNQIYFGRGAYGIEAAAQNYFSKSAADLNIAEAALLAGMPKAPSRYGRDIHAPETQSRKAHVLRRMREERMITESDYDEAINMHLEVTGKTGQLNRAPYVAEMVRSHLIERYGSRAVYEQGLIVHTTIDLGAQLAAERAIDKGVQAYMERHEPGSLPHQYDPEDVQYSLLSIDNQTGGVLALAGGTDFYTNQFNRATDAQRQSGSAFKPLIFSAAIEQGYSASSVLIDAPLIYQSPDLVWKPENYSEKFYGPTSLRRALAKSRNVISIKLVQEVGIDAVIDHIRRLGISSPVDRNLSIALGSSGVSLWEITRAYAVYPSGGKLLDLHLISRVEDRDGGLLESAQPRPRQVMDKRDAYIVNDMLVSVIEEGTGRRARVLERPAGGKTGTTNDFNDAWFMGFTQQVTTGVWCGFDSPVTLGRYETGAKAALPVWTDFMVDYHQGRPVREFAVPEGIVFRRVDPQTGLLARPGDSESRYELFIDGNQPREYSGSGDASNTEELFRLREGLEP